MGSLHLQCWCWDAEAKISAKTPVQSVLAGDYPPSLHAEPVEQLLSDLKFNTVHTKGQCKASRTGLRTIWFKHLVQACWMCLADATESQQHSHNEVNWSCFVNTDGWGSVSHAWLNHQGWKAAQWHKALCWPVASWGTGSTLQLLPRVWAYWKTGSCPISLEKQRHFNPRPCTL